MTKGSQPPRDETVQELLASVSVGNKREKMLHISKSGEVALQNDNNEFYLKGKPFKRSYIRDMPSSLRWHK